MYIDIIIIGENIISFTIPKDTPNGDYLFRVEQVGLHVASSINGAQFYISCGQITVTGGGSGTPGPLVAFPGAYSATDPGLLIDIYYPIVSVNNISHSEGYTSRLIYIQPTNYTIPGPAVWTGGSGGSSPTSSSPGGGATTTSPPSTTVKTTTTTTTSTGPTGSIVPEYGQCGGQGWTGGTVCASPYTCQVSNAYFSQCL